MKLIAGALSASGNKGTLVNNTPITSTTSTGHVYLGYSVQFSPKVSSTALVLANYTGSNNTAGDGGFLGILQLNNLVNPAGGSAAAGLEFLTANLVSAAGGNSYDLTLAGLATGLTPGNNYTFSLTCNAVTGGTFSFAPANSNFSTFAVIEL